MHEIKKVLMNELYEHEEKLKKMPNTRISQQDIDRIHKITDTVKNIDKIEMLEEGEYSEADDWMGEGRIYGTSYGRRKRDSMGRYSKNDGYSEEMRDGYHGRGYSRAEGGDRMVEQLEDMLENAHTPKMREAIKRCISEVRQG